MDLGLGDKTVIVTGASGGIGRGLVQGFAEEGAKVVLASRDEAKCQEVADSCAELAGETLVVATDVTDAASVKALSDATREALDRLTARSAGNPRALWRLWSGHRNRRI